ncbi:MAG: Xaa-Pro peptidase family protein [Acidimicrobiia bacterium]|nr:Xaa-Pro peptidase family protein [Acidimicrobiia bacterium]
MFDYGARVQRLQQTMADRGVDAAVFSVGADLPYLTGYTATPTERLTVLVVPQDGTPTLVVPQLEAPRVEPGAFTLTSWGETEDPVSLAASSVDTPRLVAAGDQMWSVFLLAFQKEWPNADWVSATELTKGLRIRKEPAEIDALRRAAHAVDRVMARIPSEVAFAGRTEREVSRQIAEMVLEEGHETAGFAIVGSGPNGASPHHEASDRVMEDGDLVVCDFGGSMDGYQSDSTRTFSIGEPSEKQFEVHSVVAAANEAGRSAVGPGVPCQEVDRAARAVIEEAGYGESFIHRTGHGIGLEVHEHPYMVEGNELQLEEGMTFSVEPGIYLPGEFGIRIEDIVACGSEDGDTLNQSLRGLFQVS